MATDTHVISAEHEFGKLCDDLYINKKGNSKTMSRKAVTGTMAFLRQDPDWKTMMFGDDLVEKQKLAYFKFNVRIMLSTLIFTVLIDLLNRPVREVTV